jgi:hypothetical protein
MKSFSFTTCVSLFLICLSLFSCRPGFNLTYLQAPPRQEIPLPRLQLIFEEQSFNNFYPLQFVAYQQVLEDGSIIYDNRAKANVQYQDIITIADRTLKNSICETQGDYYGTARLKVSSCSVNDRAMGLRILSIFTLGVLNAVGMPHGGVEAVMEFELDIVDTDGVILGNYIGQGRASQLQGFYYGEGSAKRSVHAKATKMAFSQIQEQVAKDASSLRKSLLITGAD